MNRLLNITPVMSNNTANIQYTIHALNTKANTRCSAVAEKATCTEVQVRDCLQPTQLLWLPVLSSVAPPSLHHKAATDTICSYSLSHNTLLQQRFVHLPIQEVFPNGLAI